MPVLAHFLLYTQSEISRLRWLFPPQLIQVRSSLRDKVILDSSWSHGVGKGVLGASGGGAIGVWEGC